MYKKIKAVATVLIVLLLLALFTLPQRYLLRTTDEMLALSAEAASAARAGDGRHAEVLSEMELLFDAAAPKLRLFLDHGAVDETAAALAACQPLLPCEDLLSSLGTLNAALSHLAGVERFHILSLL